MLILILVSYFNNHEPFISSSSSSSGMDCMILVFERHWSFFFLIRRHKNHTDNMDFEIRENEVLIHLKSFGNSYIFYEFSSLK